MYYKHYINALLAFLILVALDPFCQLHSKKVCHIKCPPNWIQLDHFLCVQNLSGLTTFTDAKFRCSQIGGEVFYLASWKEFNLLLSKLSFSPNDRFWIEPSETGYTCGIVNKSWFQLDVGETCLQDKAETLCQLSAETVYNIVDSI